MTIGALAFLNPWLLAAAAALPVIYWLLRTIPPRPRQVEFPPTRILAGIENREKTPATTPWWLLLIRLLAAALVILALAEPVLNPSEETELSGNGPVVIAVDNGWSSAASWTARTDAVARFIDEAEAKNRTVVILPTAAGAKIRQVRIEAPAAARSTAAALQPLPFAPDRKASFDALNAALNGEARTGVSVVWLTDSIDHDGTADAFARGLVSLASGGSFIVIDSAASREPLGLTGYVAASGALSARILRADGGPREGVVNTFSAKGARLGEMAFKLAHGETVKEIAFEMPLELRNQVTRMEIANERSAGAVSLLDARSQWQRVGLVSGEAQEEAQPLLAPLYYIQKAVQPFAEVIRPKDQNLAVGIASVLKQQASVLVLADIGTLSGEAAEAVDDWVKKGGVLVRFAGPRLEKGGDDLMPVPLRLGGRALGGALSWSTPQPLAAFDGESLFAGLAVPSDVLVKRQILADPARLGPEVQVWARLADGTPLVTATRRGQGRLILFHITANSDWSNLPISGLFVEMLRRITTLGGMSGPIDTSDKAADNATAAPAGEEATASAAPDAPNVLAPLRTLDGFGILRTPPGTAQALLASAINDTPASLDHPPGYYGPAGSPRAINVLREESSLSALPPLPEGAELRNLDIKAAVALKPWLLAAALALLFADIAAVLSLQGGLRLGRGAGRAASAGTAALLLIATLPVPAARAQFLDGGDELDRYFEQQFRRPTLGPRFGTEPPKKSYPAGPDGVAEMATDRVTLAYALTGNPEIDNVSKLGLSGLGRVLAVRTAVEPNEPVGVDVAKDEIAFYPVLYWPVLPNAEPLPDAALAKIDAYMKQGGMIVFDTRDYSSGVPTGVAAAGKNGVALERLIGKLDLPRLEPVPEDHVLTRSFYLMRSFPGRWDGGQLWVEADETRSEDDGERKARRADGVTSIIITANDFAAAWALDRLGRPLYPTVPGGEQQREMALRGGVNIVMHALTGNYKADQVHVPALLERLGQ